MARDKTYDNAFRVDHQGGNLADLTVENLGDGKVRISSSDGQYDVTCKEHNLKFTLQQLEDKLHEDTQFGIY